MQAHNVYFKLEDDSPEAVQTLVNLCQKYLGDHPGILSFAVGTLAEGLARDVNDRDFEVALQIIFADRAAHDAYQTAELHDRFIEEGKSNWHRVRVFDADLASYSGDR